MLRQADEEMYLGSTASDSAIVCNLPGANNPLPHLRQTPLDILKLLDLHQTIFLFCVFCFWLLVPYPWGFWLRWLKQRLTRGFEKAGLEFNVEYVTTIRNWCDSMAQFSTLSGAYRKRKGNDPKQIPHSFTFARRDSAMVDVVVLVPNSTH